MGVSATPHTDGSAVAPDLGPAPRVPQGERTRLMRLRLMEATVECLVELGWTGTTTTVVSQRAGVSRGAQLHHFPSKQDLVVAAVEHLTERRRHELAQSAADLPAEGRTRAALDLIAAQYVSPVFFAALELWLAARTDAVLRDAVVPLERRFGRDAHAYTVALLGVDERRGQPPARAGHPRPGARPRAGRLTDRRQRPSCVDPRRVGRDPRPRAGDLRWPIPPRRTP